MDPVAHGLHLEAPGVVIQANPRELVEEPVHQTLHLFEGQLKELQGCQPKIGERYRVTFRPFINNRWVELKIIALQPLTEKLS